MAAAKVAEAFRYSSSLRARSLSQTLVHARRIGREVGVTRVTDTTRLDRIGIPVFASIRPTAHPASLHVSAGKGQTVAEAEIGAWMEAIELAYAEPQRACVRVLVATAGEVLDGRRRHDAIYDLCPRRGIRSVDPAAPLSCVEAVDVTTGSTCLVPAELVLMPAPRLPGASSFFGGDGNGLASGNAVDEATVHALAEVMERDVMAFHFARDESQRVRNDTLPGPLRALAVRLDARGFELIVRHQHNVFGLPWFKALVWERDAVAGPHAGFGCSPLRELAVSRAICEAMQARLTVIHGARDDLRPSPATMHAGRGRALAASAADPNAIDFPAAPDHGDRVTDIPSALELLLARVRGAGFERVLRVVYTPPDLPLQVVRVLVPGLEINIGHVDREGRRLQAFRAEIAGMKAR
jgi:ribosomal protein S12 methylthiotransferase accessory factor